jgi:hypothetical protein
MATRDERLEDLFFVDITSQGNPSEEGQLRYVNTDILAYINGAVRSILQDELAKVSANDTTAAYLIQKIVAGSGITINELNDGANETLLVEASDSAWRRHFLLMGG